MKTDEWCTDCKEYDNEKHCCPRFNHVIREALKDAGQRWIPCSERLPEPYAHVILTIRGTDMIKVEDGETLEQALERNNQTYWVTKGYLADDGWIGGDGFPLIVKPIAWMEFPEPWKGEENDL